MYSTLRRAFGLLRIYSEDEITVPISEVFSNIGPLPWANRQVE